MLTLKLVMEVPERVQLSLPQVDKLQISLAAPDKLHDHKLSSGLRMSHFSKLTADDVNSTWAAIDKDAPRWAGLLRQAVPLAGCL